MSEREVIQSAAGGEIALDPALAPFARATALAFAADGRTIVWGATGALALFGGRAPVPAPKALAAAVERVVRAIGGSGGATLAGLPLPGIEGLASCACRLVRRDEDGDLLVVVPLDALPAPAAPEAPAPAEPLAVAIDAAGPPVSDLPLATAPYDPPAPEPEPEPEPPAAETATEPPAPAPATPLEAIRRRADGRGIVRFLWQSDGEGVIRRLSPDFAAILGPEAAAIEGRSLAEAFSGISSPEGDGLAGRLARRETVSGARILWAGFGGAIEVPVDVSAMPILEAGQAFRGFRGFGLIRVAEAREASPRETASPTPEDAAPVVDEPATSERPADGEPATPSPDEPPAGDAPVAILAVDPAAAPEIEGPAPRSDAVPPPACDPADAITHRPADPAEDHSVAAILGDASVSDLATTVEPAKDDVPPMAASAVEEPDADLPHAPDAAAAAPAQPAPPPKPSAPVLAFRRGDGDAPAASAANVVPLRIVQPSLSPPRPADPSAPAALSTQERRAFRDIARALGARVEDEQSAPTPPEPEEPAAPPAEPALTAPLAISAPVEPPATPPPAAPAPVAPRTVAAEAPPEPSSPAAHALDILERIPVGVLVSRADRILFANQTLLDLLDYASIGAIEAGGGLRDLFRSRSPETAAEFAAISPVLLKARDGETLAVDARIQALDWDGRKATLMTVRRSVEAEHGQRLRSTELDLRAREADLRETRSILDTATDGVIVMDDRGRVLSMNRAAEALFGYDQKEIAGEPYTVLMAPESHAVAVDYLEGLKSGGVRSVLNDGREVIGRVRQGGPQPLFMTLGQVADTPDRKFCAVLRDLTPWKKAESEMVEARKAAERANHQKSEFLAKISHEIRTPLNAIIGFAEVMMEERFGPVGNERYKDYLKDVHGSGQHVISLVNDLLDLSKIEAGRMELTFAAVDVNATVSSSVSILQPQAQQGRVVVRTSLSRKLPPVVADQRSLKQIVLNLLSNAVKFTDPGGQVIVSTGLGDNGDVMIRVRDTGIGMSEKEIGEALEPFRQLHTTRRAGGTGLGLPLTKALVEANRASLRISSARREGTLVEVVFPPTRVLAE